MAVQELIVDTPLRAEFLNGRVYSTQKFVEGLTEYARYWPGRVTALLMGHRDPTDTNLDWAWFNLADLPVGIEPIGEDTSQMAARLRRASVLLTTPFSRICPLARQIGLPIVQVTECTLKTRIQMVHAEAKSLSRRCARQIKECLRERRVRATIGDSAGVQCNGTPTFDSYSQINANSMLFFDSRTRDAMYADAGAVRRRYERLRGGAPLRMAFSGRLVAIKGTQHLPHLAEALRRLGVRFHLDIFGDGPLRQPMQEEIAGLGLDALVKFHGNVDFGSQLLPCLRDEIDLFVCCHRQGDPSCTYLETMSQGVPIAGYGNEAWVGILNRVDVGWAVKTGDYAALAARIAALDVESIQDAAMRALTFAREHTFEATMARRVAHCQACAEASRKNEMDWQPAP